MTQCLNLTRHAEWKVPRTSLLMMGEVFFARSSDTKPEIFDGFCGCVKRGFFPSWEVKGDGATIELTALDS